jgi:hypothetical protein
MLRLMPVLFLLFGCPKKEQDTRSIIERERDAQLNELLNDEDEFLEGIPESEFEDEEEPDTGTQQ